MKQLPKTVLGFMAVLLGAWLVVGGGILSFGGHMTVENPAVALLVSLSGLELAVGGYVLGRSSSAEIVLRSALRLLFLWGALNLVLKLPVSVIMANAGGEKAGAWASLFDAEITWSSGFGILAILNWVWFERKLKPKRS